MIPMRNLIDELLFARVIMLDNEDQLDNILIEMKIHKDEFLIVIVEEDEQLEAKDTNFDEDLTFIEDWIANPKEVEDVNLHF